MLGWLKTNRDIRESNRDIYIYTYLRHESPILHWPAAGTWWSSDLIWILVEVILCGFLSSQYMFIIVIKNPPKFIGFQYYFIMKTGWWLGGNPHFFFPTMVTTPRVARSSLGVRPAGNWFRGNWSSPCDAAEPIRRKNRKWLKIHDYHMTGGITIQLYQLF